MSMSTTTSTVVQHQQLLDKNNLISYSYSSELGEALESELNAQNGTISRETLKNFLILKAKKNTTDSNNKQKKETNVLTLRVASLILLVLISAACLGWYVGKSTDGSASKSSKSSSGSGNSLMDFLADSDNKYPEYIERFHFQNGFSDLSNFVGEQCLSANYQIALYTAGHSFWVAIPLLVELNDDDDDDDDDDNNDSRRPENCTLVVAADAGLEEHQRGGLQEEQSKDRRLNKHWTILKEIPQQDVLLFDGLVVTLSEYIDAVHQAATGNPPPPPSKSSSNSDAGEEKVKFDLLENNCASFILNVAKHLNVDFWNSPATRNQILDYMTSRLTADDYIMGALKRAYAKKSFLVTLYNKIRGDRVVVRGLVERYMLNSYHQAPAVQEHQQQNEL